MTALAENSMKSHKTGDRVSYPVATGVHIYKGAAVCFNASGYLAPAANTTGFVFAGVALEECDNTLGANGALYCEVHIKNVSYPMATTGAAITDIGKLAWIVDDATISITKTAYGVCMGRIAEVKSATNVWVCLNATFKMPAISELSDVTITAAANGEVLKHNGTVWVDAADAT